MANVDCGRLPWLSFWSPVFPALLAGGCDRAPWWGGRGCSLRRGCGAAPGCARPARRVGCPFRVRCQVSSWCGKCRLRVVCRSTTGCLAAGVGVVGVVPPPVA